MLGRRNNWRAEAPYCRSQLREFEMAALSIVFQGKDWKMIGYFSGDWNVEEVLLYRIANGEASRFVNAGKMEDEAS